MCVGVAHDTIGSISNIITIILLLESDLSCLIAAQISRSLHLELGDLRGL